MQTIDRRIEKMLKDGELVEANRQSLRQFNSEKTVSGMAPGTRWLFCYTMRRIDATIRKPFQEMNKADLLAYWSDQRRTKLKSNSERKCTKVFLQWAYGMKKGTYPESIEWLGFNKNKNKKLPEELLTPDEVKRLISCTKSIHDAALAHVLYESGCRIGELMAIRVKHIQLDNYGAIVMLRGKTGDRRCRLIDSVPILNRWLSEHPMKSNPESYLFFGKNPEKGISDRQVIAKVLKKAAKRAGIKKRVHCHLFRHSRATVLAKSFTEAELKQIFGWTGGSTQPATYVHLSAQDVDSKFLALAGLKPIDKAQENPLLARKCYRCGQDNEFFVQSCSKCFALLDPRAIAHKEAEDRATLETAAREAAQAQIQMILGASKAVDKQDERIKELEKQLVELRAVKAVVLA
ncbi:MAG: tyrosine-type recombinase/integrase [Candidatus Micrarchaeota archaeon]